MRVILASNRGTLMELGISPIVTSGRKFTHRPKKRLSLLSASQQIWPWVNTNGTISGQVHHPFESILVGIGMFTGGTGFDPWPYVSKHSTCLTAGMVMQLLAGSKLLEVDQSVKASCQLLFFFFETVTWQLYEVH